MLQADPLVFLFAALLLLLLPMNWLLSAIFAAAFHELCHILAIILMKGRIRKIHVRWNGCEIETDRVGELQQFISILVGPLGSLSLVLLCRQMPRITVCGFIQGIYNLLPLMPLDGGRLLRIILYHICPEMAETLMQRIGMILRIGITMLLILAIFLLKQSLLPFFLLAIWHIRLSRRKTPCKPFKIGVQ